MNGKRWVTTLIVAAMILICAGTVYADKTITGLGTGAIANPDAQNGGGWSYVYYGKYSGSPVKYRVLDKASTDFGVTGGSLLLDCDTILYNAYYNDGNIGFWANSSLRGGLNGGSFLNKAGVFTGAELDAIAVSKKAAGGLFAPLTSDEDHQDRIFILDNEESLMKPYGYDVSNRGKSGVSEAYWLRPANEGDSVIAIVDGNIAIIDVIRNYEIGCQMGSPTVGVSPAFNVKLSSILFSSLVNGAAGETGASYKLTLKDDNLKIELDGDVTRKCNNTGTITIPYKVTNDTDNGIVANQVSVLMTNASWKDGWSIDDGSAPQYSYAELNDDGTLTLPSNYESLNIYILAEQVNGDRETDYASAPLKITVPQPSHTWKDATCTEPKTCTSCSDTDGKPLGHDMVKTDEVKAACTGDGTEEYWTCKNCKKLFSDKDGKTEIKEPAAIPKTGHALVKTDEVNATCTKDGTKAYWTCKTCKKMFSDKDGKTEITKPAVISKTGHVWGDWKIMKEPTETATGEKQRVCKNDPSHVEKETIPVKKAELKPTPETDTMTKPETEPKAKVKTVSGIPLAKMIAKGKNSLKISWVKVNGAEGYDIFFAACGKNEKKTKCKLVKTITGNSKYSWTKSKLKAKKSYKAYVKAWVMENGKKKYVGTSPLVHAFTANGTKTQTNARSVTVEKAKISVKRGKTKQINADVKKVKSKLTLMGRSHAAKLRYLSTNKKIATVNNSGKIKGIRKGSCYVYVYAHNGVSKRITVKVN